MGAATIVENSITQNTQTFWNKVGDKFPDISLDTSKYNKGFVNFAMLVGLYATIKVSVYGAKKLQKAITVNKALSKSKFQ